LNLSARLINHDAVFFLTTKQHQSVYQPQKPSAEHHFVIAALVSRSIYMPSQSSSQLTWGTVVVNKDTEYSWYNLLFAMANESWQQQPPPVLLILPKESSNVHCTACCAYLATCMDHRYLTMH
jgi:hypothetical protein